MGFLKMKNPVNKIKVKKAVEFAAKHNLMHNETLCTLCLK